MSRHEKLLERLKRKPRDFEWSELERLLNNLGYKQEPNDGSRRKFYNETTGALIAIHQPHPQSVLRSYQVKDVLNHLKEWDLL